MDYIKPIPKPRQCNFYINNTLNNIQKLVATKISASFSNNTTLTDLLLIYTSVSNNSNQPIPSVAKTTTVGRKDTVMGGTSKKGNMDIFNS